MLCHNFQNIGDVRGDCGPHYSEENFFSPSSLDRGLSYKSAMRSLGRRKVEWIDQAENLLPGIAPALSAVTGNPVPALPLFSGFSSPEKTFEPLRRSEPSTPMFYSTHTRLFLQSQMKNVKLWSLFRFALFRVKI